MTKQGDHVRLSCLGSPSTQISELTPGACAAGSCSAEGEQGGAAADRAWIVYTVLLKKKIARSLKKKQKKTSHCKGEKKDSF